MLRKALTSAGALAAVVLTLAGRPAEGHEGSETCVEACRSKAEEKGNACMEANCKGSCKDDESQACDDCLTQCVESLRSQLTKCTRRCGAAARRDK